MSHVAQVRLKGFKPVAKSFSTLKLAQHWAEGFERKLKHDREGGHVASDFTQLNLATLAHRFLDDPETNARRYHDRLESYLSWWIEQYGSTRVTDCGAALLRAARDRLSKGKAPATVNRYLAALRTAWNWARAAQLIPQRLGWPPRLLLSEPKARSRHLSDAEREALLKAAEKHSPVMYAAIFVSIATGLRLSELLRLKWADIDFDAESVRVLVSKNDEPRSVHLPPEAAEVLRGLADKPRPTAPVFVDGEGRAADVDWIEGRWKKIRSTAGLEDFRWHDLRHTTASYLAQGGSSLPEIGAVLGHKSPAATARYAHFVQGKPVTGHDKLRAKLRRAQS
jgi:integrase